MDVTQASGSTLTGWAHPSEFICARRQVTSCAVPVRLVARPRLTCSWEERPSHQPHAGSRDGKSVPGLLASGRSLLRVSARDACLPHQVQSELRVPTPASEPPE